MSSPSQQFVVNNCSTQFNVAFFNVAPLRENGSRAIFSIFGIAASVLFTALQLKYQARSYSPFHDHPQAMAIAIASLLVLCLGCDMEQHLVSGTSRCSSFATLLHHVLRLIGFISLASLASVIFSTTTSSTSWITVYLIFPWFFSARFVLHWIENKNLHGNRGTNNLNNLHPHFAFNLYRDRIYTLPVYHTASANPVQ